MSLLKSKGLPRLSPFECLKNQNACIQEFPVAGYWLVNMMVIISCSESLCLHSMSSVHSDFLCSSHDYINTL